jgi:hypothetical protein
VGAPATTVRSLTRRCCGGPKDASANIVHDERLRVLAGTHGPLDAVKGRSRPADAAPDPSPSAKSDSACAPY